MCEVHCYVTWQNIVKLIMVPNLYYISSDVELLLITFVN